MNDTDYINFNKHLLQLNPSFRFIYGYKDKNTLSHIENTLDDIYIQNLKEIIDKYKNKNHIELKLQISLMEFYLNNNLNLLLFSSFYNFIIHFEYMNEYLYPPNDDYKNSRINDFDMIINTIMKKAKLGISMNITYPKIIIKKFLQQIKPLYKYQSLYKFIHNNYYPYCRTDIGLCYIKNGKDIYSFIIKEYIGFLDLTPEQIHNIGLNSIKDIDISKNNNNNNNDFYKSREEMFKDCLIFAKKTKQIISSYFHKFSHSSIVIKPVPEELELNSSIAYFDDNNNHNHIYINLSYFNEINKNELYLIIVHECAHFYYNSYIKFFKVPKYKIYGYSNVALIEGFAYYFESLIENYDDNNTSSLLRKLRIIVDTGINYYGWTYKQALDYLNSYIPHKKRDNQYEIDRYICHPGQSLSYFIGKMHILKLKDFYLKKNKNKTIKDFHHELLMEGSASFVTLNKKFNYDYDYNYNTSYN